MRKPRPETHENQRGGSQNHAAFTENSIHTLQTRSKQKQNAK